LGNKKPLQEVIGRRSFQNKSKIEKKGGMYAGQKVRKTIAESQK